MLNSSLTDPEVDKPEAWQLFLAAISYAVAILSPSLNLLVVYVISRRKELRTPTNAFIASLALGEMIFGMFSLPFFAASLLSNLWPFSTTTCKGSAFLQVLGRTTSTYCLVFLCLDRYIAVSRPLKYSNIVTATFSAVSVICIWCFSLFCSIFMLLLWDPYHYMNLLFLCTVEVRVYNLPYLIKDIISVYIPTFFILTCVVLVVKEVKSHHRIFAIIPMPDNIITAQVQNSVVAGIFPFSRAVGFNRNTRRALRSFLVMALSYIFFCLPSSVSGTLHARSRQGLAQSALLVPVWLSFLYTVVNPVIIIIFNRKFCSRLKLVFGWWRCNKIHPAQEVFTISSGLHSILDTTLVKNLGVTGGKISSTFSDRRK